MKDKELQSLINEQALDMNTDKIIKNKAKRRKMTLKDYIKWQELKNNKGRL